MRQVFFITDDRITAMLWQGSRLISEYEFEEGDKESLSKYLEKSSNIVSSIIVDVLEEEITLTTIPHGRSHERKFLIDRALTRLHRGAEFATANIIGRENNKRRDDRLLVSGITESGPLLKLLDVFNEHKMLIKGVYSLPLIAGSVLKVLKVKKGLTLVVSRQSHKFIRQSIFEDGKLFYSRNIPSQENFKVDMFSDDLQKTRKYLENQKFLTTGDSIDVVILSSEQFYEQLKGLGDLLTGMNVSYIKHDDLKKTLGIKSKYSIAGREIFSSLLLGSMTKNHYARSNDLELYKKSIRKRLINYSSVAVAVILVLITSKFYIDIDVLEHKVKGVEEQVKILKEHNDRLEKNLSSLPVQAKKMKLFVNNVSNIKQLSEDDIKASMVAISQVFNAYKNISLTGFNWSVNEADYNSRSKSRTKKRKNNSANNAQVIELVAKVDFSTLTNQDTSKIIEKFLAAIRGLDSVKQVTVTKKAIRASSSDVMTGVVAGKQKNESNISLTVVMEAAHNAS